MDIEDKPQTNYLPSDLEITQSSTDAQVNTANSTESANLGNSNITPVASNSILNTGTLQSPNFSHLTSGWKIDAAGNAEFNGTIIAGGYTQVFRQSSIPVSLHINDVWIDTDDSNKMYIALSVGADQIAAGEWVLTNPAAAWSTLIDDDGHKPDNDATVGATMGTNLIDNAANTPAQNQVANYESLTTGEHISAGDSVQLGLETTTDYLPSDDCYARSDEATTVHNGTTVLVGVPTATMYGFFKFDFSNYPTTSARLVSATFYIYHLSDNAGTVTAKKVTSADWAEGTLTYNNMPSVGTSIGSFVDDGGVGFFSMDITAQVKNWIDGTDPNYGFRLEKTGGQTTYASKTYATTADSPYLVLVYDDDYIYKATAINPAANVNKWIGMSLDTKNAGESARIQYTNVFTTTGLTAGSIYYQSDTRGSIATSAGTNSKKIGVALATTKLLILNT